MAGIFLENVTTPLSCVFTLLPTCPLQVCSSSGEILAPTGPACGDGTHCLRAEELNTRVPSMGYLCWAPAMPRWVPRLVPWRCPPALPGWCCVAVRARAATAGCRLVPAGGGRAETCPTGVLLLGDPGGWGTPMARLQSHPCPEPGGCSYHGQGATGMGTSPSLAVEPLFARLSWIRPQGPHGTACPTPGHCREPLLAGGLPCLGWGQAVPRRVPAKSGEGVGQSPAPSPFCRRAAPHQPTHGPAAPGRGQEGAQRGRCQTPALGTESGAVPGATPRPSEGRGPGSPRSAASSPRAGIAGRAWHGAGGWLGAGPLPRSLLAAEELKTQPW